MQSLADVLNEAQVKPIPDGFGAHKLVHLDGSDYWNEGIKIVVVPDEVFVAAVVAVKNNEGAMWFLGTWVGKEK